MAKAIVASLFFLLTACGELPASGGFPVIVPTQPWEGDNIEDGSGIKVDGIHYRFYCAGNLPLHIGFATATDFPYQWEKYPNNPIILAQNVSPGGVTVCAPRVIEMPDGSFRMYVHAYNWHTDRAYLFTASREDFPAHWTIANNGEPVMIEGPDSWESFHIQSQAFIPPWDSPDNRWHMFYIGSDSHTFRGGHAVSDNGIEWEKLPGPIMEPSSGWLARHVGPLSWRKKDGKYYILVQGFDGKSWSVGYYTSTDLTHFEPEPDPILRGEFGMWYSSGIEGADIYEDDGETWLFFLGSNIPNDVRGGFRYRVGVTKLEDE